MNDDLEAELAGFRPVKPSPALERRLAERFAVAPRRPSRKASIALVAWAVAAALLLLLARPNPNPEPHRDHLAPLAAEPAPIPTYAAFRRAIADSPDALDALPTFAASPRDETPPVTFHSDLDLFQ